MLRTIMINIKFLNCNIMQIKALRPNNLIPDSKVYSFQVSYKNKFPQLECHKKDITKSYTNKEEEKIVDIQKQCRQNIVFSI